jgi:copper(I)-binding protein
MQIMDAKAAATPPGAMAGAVYLELIAAADDELLSVTTPVAELAEIHETTHSNGMMEMRPVTAVTLKAGQTVRFAPGGMHVMLMNLHQPLTADQEFPLNLRFKNSGDVSTRVRVMAPDGLHAWH